MSLKDLRREAAHFRSHCWARATRTAYATHRRSYLKFCHTHGLIPVPACTDTLQCYAAHLARRLKPSSIRQYLNIVRILHLEWGLPNPLDHNYHLNATLRGIRRVKGDSVTRKAPVTPRMLFAYLHHLDLSHPLHITMWAAALTMFFGILRKSNVLPLHPTSFDPTLHLRRQDLTVTPQGITIHIRWSKTNQFRSRTHSIPLPRITDHPLCPSQAVYLAMQRTQQAPPEGPAFVYRSNGHWVPLTSTRFLEHFKRTLSSTMDVSNLGGHSFRRGGATWAYQAGVPVDVIRQLGDWTSNAYTIYTLPNSHMLKSATEAMAKALPSPTRPVNIH